MFIAHKVKMLCSPQEAFSWQSNKWSVEQCLLATLHFLCLAKHADHAIARCSGTFKEEQTGEKKNE